MKKLLVAIFLVIIICFGVIGFTQASHISKAHNHDNFTPTITIQS